MPFEKYGMRWPDDTEPLEIEMYAIRQNGKWLNKGKECGHGLPFHYGEMRKIVWPELDEHRWNIICRDSILNNKICVLMGPGSSGKTHSAAWVYLCEWLCFPEETCVLVSSTDMRGLKLRVWGEITSLWERAVQRFDYLPGHLLDSKCAITFESLEDDGDFDDRKVRDMRKGIIGIPTVQGGKQVGLGKWVGLKQKRVRLIADECFPAGTMVDTDRGPRPIESIRPGDLVRNAGGMHRVRGVFTKNTTELYQVKAGGREIVCTGNHEFFTNNGWVSACDLTPLHYMVSTYEAMQLLRGDVPATEQQQSVPEVPRGETQPGVQGMFKAISSESDKRFRDFLRSKLHAKKSSQGPVLSREILQSGAQSEGSGCEKEILRGASREAPSVLKAHDKTQPHDAAGGGGENEKESPHEKTGASPAPIEPLPKTGARLAGEVQNQRRSNRCGEGALAVSPGSGVESSGWEVPDRCSRSVENAGRGSRWAFSFSGGDEGAGREKDGGSAGAWVESVKVLEQDDFEQYRTSEEGAEVYTLEVEGHHTYSVLGFCVANCQFMSASFLSAFANLNKNEDFRAIPLGNPLDLLDPLGRAAEPKDGWDAHMEPEKTEVWQTRFMNGVCVNLIGTDSPNFDYPESEPTRYKYLISREKIADTLSFFPKDSIEYYSQCVGVMKVGQMARRVLTRRLCEQNRALETDVSWEASTTKIFAVDAAYGGDRAVGIYAEFGKAVGGKILLKLHPPKIIPISVKIDKEPEYQIAEWVKNECLGLGVPPENMFHDSTGRGSLGTALARVWSAMTNPVEFGGVPSKRPVSLDTYVWDQVKRIKRLKTCYEHYVKKVTELWFSVRYSVEAGQLRGLSEDTMEEFCLREWRRVKDDKIEVETKDEMKERVGRSPDLADAASIICEAARQRGFQISRLASDETDDRDFSWLEKQAESVRKMKRSKDLTPA